ncbi:MAG: outer membrane beta-barrel protein [Ferruginibacter sp.]|nr:outer membrane beta-barrel protein [Ferruginibacter sp.]
MKKILSVFVAVALISTAFGQKKKDWSKLNIDRAGDHFMIQISKDNWAGAPDSIKNRMKGFSRGLNIAIMMNKPFKGDPRWSVALGLAVSHSSIFFKNTSVDVKSSGTLLPFRNLDSTDHYKKYKLATTFAEVPIELRYTFDPVNEKKSWKIAVGVKVGTMLNTHTKGKTLQNKSNTTINSFTEKESKKAFFNGTRLAGTARVGIGNFSLFGAYSITSLLKDVAGPTIRPYQIGLCISGL